MEDSAKYDYEWFGGLMPFDSVDREGGGEEEVLVVSGDQIRLQNGFGAKRRYRYSCKYRPATREISVQLVPY